MRLMVTGGGYVTAAGYGTRGDGKAVALGAGEPVVPKGREVFDNPPSRFGRFDAYTRMGLAAAGLALRDAGLHIADEKRCIGIVTSSATETLETDIAYYATTLEEGGAFASPNLFSYTLPGIVQGECAVLFKMTGPTFCVGDDGQPGRAALLAGAAMLAAGKAPAVLVGWIESPPDDPTSPTGALFVVVESDPDRPGTSLVHENGRVAFPDGRDVGSLLDLFHPDSDRLEVTGGSPASR